MSFVYTKCYKCNKRVKVNDAEDAWICKFCKKPFVIEKAMKLYRENSHDGEHVRKKVEVKKASANVSADSMIPENIVITMPIEGTPAVKPDIKRAELSVSKAEPKNPESSAPKVELKETEKTAPEPEKAEVAEPKKTEVSEQKSEDDKAEETAPKAEQAKAEDPEKDEFVIKFTNLEKYIGNSEHVVVPVGVKRISDNAFEGCETIKKVELPGGVEEIGGYAFHNCKNLEEIVIPVSLLKIGSWAF